MRGDKTIFDIVVWLAVKVTWFKSVKPTTE
jgi:hypothetical protein